MGKGCSDFRTTQIHSVVKPLESHNEQVKHAEILKAWEIPEHDLAVRVAIKYWILKARKEFRLSALDLPLPILSYKLRGNILGQAWYRKWQISLNPTYLDHYPKEQIDNTIPHEIAHLVCDKLYAGMPEVYPHGKEWQAICMKLGHYPEVRCKRVGRFKQVKEEIARNLNVDDF